MRTPDPKRRWFRLSPDRFVLGLLLVIGLLWLSEQFQWFGFNHHKGWTVLIAVAAVGVAALVMLLWWIVSLIFRWHFQFGIRSLLVFCLASSIAVSWLGLEKGNAERQRVAAEEFGKLGGFVQYDYEVRVDEIGNWSGITESPPGLGWLRKLLGGDFFTNAITVDFAADEFDQVDIGANESDRSSVNDDRLVGVKALAQLQALGLGGTETTDAGLVNLEGLPRLEWLALAATKITDAGLVHLKGLKQLRTLSLWQTQITDTGLEHLEGLNSLSHLNLEHTKVTAEGVKKFKQALPKCEIER